LHPIAAGLGTRSASRASRAGVRAADTPASLSATIGAEEEKMAAYLIYARRAITDEEKSRQYSQQVLPSIRQYGGEVAAARGAEYAPLKQLRRESNVGDVVVIEGM
jgi:uncharacterized protein (DUF1330 family)